MKTKLNLDSSSVECRKVYTQTLSDLMSSNPNIVVMDADLVSASGSSELFKKYPQRCINVGISEANMMGVAAGMSLIGLVPYIHTFAPFATRRMYDQIYVSGAYQNSNVRIFGSDPGFWAAHNGGTHTSIEDIALMRVIPNMNVLAPADGVALKWVVEETAKQYGVYYIRAPRKAVPTVYDESMTFEIGKAIVTVEGSDGVIFTMGEMVHESMKAAQQLLDTQGLSIAVVDMFSLKPLDEETVRNILVGKKFALSVENHSIINGLGSAISQVISSMTTQIPHKQVGIVDHFGEVGTQEFLQAKYKLTVNDIIDTIKSF